MSVGLQPKLTVGELMPPFTLPSTRGGNVSLWDFKELRNLVLVFLPGGDCAECEEFIHSLLDHAASYEEEWSAVLVVVRDTEWHANALLEKLHPSLPILYDKIGGVIETYTNCLPAVFVADRFGELLSQWIVGPGGLFPSQKEILDVVELANLECPECGAKVEWA